MKTRRNNIGIAHWKIMVRFTGTPLVIVLLLPLLLLSGCVPFPSAQNLPDLPETTKTEGFCRESALSEAEHLSFARNTLGEKASDTADTRNRIPESPINDSVLPPSPLSQPLTDKKSRKLPIYTGEKIQLDFFQTDIKNVFRMLRRVSKMNFAVDDDVKGRVTMTLEHPVPWDQVLDLVLRMNRLGKKQEGSVIRICTVKTLRAEEKQDREMATSKQETLARKRQLAVLQTEYIPVNYSDASRDILPHVERVLTPGRGIASVDKRTNMLVVTDTAQSLSRIRDIIFRLDQVTPQILIEAKVVEVTKKFSRSLGVAWSLSNDPGLSQGFVDDFNVSVNRSVELEGVGADFSFFRLAGHSSILNARLEASEQQGDIKIVSSPRILTLNHKKARIKQGMEYAYLERDDSGGASVKFKDVDLLLEVTPHVTSDGRISMTVKLTKNDIADTTVGGAPIVTTNEAETELLVDNRNTIVIGGIVKTSQSKKNTGVPLFRRIPVLGSLFGTHNRANDRNELLIFMTPTIVQLHQKK